MRQLNHRSLTATGLAIAATTAGAVAAVPAGAVPTAGVTGGHSSIAVEKAFSKALQAHGIKLKTTGPATYKRKTLKLPITGGDANPPAFVLKYAGGVKLVDSGKTVSIRKLKADSTTSTVTAAVNGKRITLFTVGAPTGGSGGAGNVTFGGYTVTLSPKAVKVLDRDLATKTFKKHSEVGIGTTTVKYAA